VGDEPLWLMAVVRDILAAQGPLAVLLDADSADASPHRSSPAREVVPTLSRDAAPWVHRGAERAARPGAVRRVLLERIAPDAFDVVVFGAGHVGQALVAALSPLPWQVLWIDSRPEVFPPVLPPSVQALRVADPLDQVDRLRPGSLVLVLTHSHALDQDLCERLLQRGDTAYLGLIGSATKRATFERRLKQRGIAPALLDTLTCPIGIGGIHGKEPAVIAAAVVAQLLQVREAGLAARLSLGISEALDPSRHRDSQRIEQLDDRRD